MTRIFIPALTLALLVPLATNAQDNFLVGIPGVNQGESGSFDAYIQAVYMMFISIAALLAVVKIVIAGVKYMFTDIVSQKGDAKKDIQGALLGLLVVISAVVILTVINPDLTRFNPDVSRVETPAAPQLSADGGDQILNYCEQVDGNCESRTCDALDDYTGEMILAGAAVGSIVPGVGTLSGILLGGATGFYLNYKGGEAECAAVCSWLNGEIIESTNSCLYPTDALAYKQAELEAVRAELKERYGCEDGSLIMLGGEFSNCINDLSSEETDKILNSLEVDPESDLAKTIIERTQNLQIQNYLVEDEATLDQLTSSVGANRVVLAIEVPISVSASDLTNIQTSFRGICTDSGFDETDHQIGTSRFIVCAE